MAQCEFRTSRLLAEREREREREGGGGGEGCWTERDRERDRDTERERDRDRERKRERERERERRKYLSFDITYETIVRILCERVGTVWLSEARQFVHIAVNTHMLTIPRLHAVKSPFSLTHRVFALSQCIHLILAFESPQRVLWMKLYRKIMWSILRVSSRSIRIWAVMSKHWCGKGTITNLWRGLNSLWKNSFVLLSLSLLSLYLPISLYYCK